MLFLLTLAVLVSSVTALSLAWRLQHRRPTGHFLRGLAAALAASGTLLFLLLAAFFVALFEPWPFSLHQGPDTDFSRGCLAEILGDPPPDGVMRVYCRQEWGFGGDDIISIRFTYNSRATVDAIVRRLQLQLVAAPERQIIRHLDGPGWWPGRAALARARQVYQKGGVDVLWVQPESSAAYFQRANF